MMIRTATAPPPPRMRVLQRRLPLLGPAVALAVLAALLAVPPTPEAAAQGNITVQFGQGFTGDGTGAGYNAREGDAVQAKLTFSSATTAQETFTINTTAGTATAGTDFTAGPHTCDVPSGRTSHVCNIPVLADDQIEDYEKFTVTLASPPPGFVLGSRSTATVQIVNVSVVPDNWSLKPSGVNAGEQFRLLFKTHNERDGSASTISTYDTFVRNRVSGASTGHADIRQYSSTFRVVGSTPTVGAAWHTATGIMVSSEPSHTPFSHRIYWLNGPKIADDYNDFWDGTWDDNSPGAHRRANGNASTNTRGPNTGTRTGTTHATAGTKKPSRALGNSSNQTRWGGGAQSQNPIDQGDIPTGNNNVYIGLSGIFEVEVESDEEFDELSASVRLDNGSAGPAQTGANVDFTFSLAKARKASDLNGIRTQLAWSGDVLSPRSDHRPATWDRYKVNPLWKPDGSARVHHRGVYVRPWLENSILVGEQSFKLRVHVKNREEAGGNVGNGWIAMRVAGGAGYEVSPDDWACMPVGGGTCPSAWPGVPAATVAGLQASVVSGQDARFSVTVNPAPGAGETRRVYLRTWYRYHRGGGQDQNQAFRHVDVGSTGTATFTMPTRVSRVGRGRTANVQVQEDIAYTSDSATASVDATRFNPSSQPCWYGHTHYPASSPYAVTSGTLRLPAMGITDCLSAGEIDDLDAGAYRTVWTTCKVDYGHTDHSHGSYNDNRGGSHGHHRSYSHTHRFGNGNCTHRAYSSQDDGLTDAQADAVPETEFPENNPVPCDAAVAIDKARAAFNWHTSFGADAPLFWRILNTLGTDDLPAKPSGVTEETISAQDVKDFSNGKGWAGWAPIVEAMERCTEPAPDPVVPDPDPVVPDPDPVVPDPEPDPDPEISIAAGTAVTEGGAATFTVSASPPPSSALSVTVTVTQSGDFAAATGPRTVTVGTSGSATVSVATTNDSSDEADGSVTATVNSGSGYTVSATANSASVTVSDDDDPSPPPPPPPPVGDPGFSIEDASGTEGEQVSVRVTLSHASNQRLRVYWIPQFGGSGTWDSRNPTWALPGSDFGAAGGWLTFRPGVVEQHLQINLLEDSLVEPAEEFQVNLLFVSPYRAVPIADGRAIITINDND